MDHYYIYYIHSLILEIQFTNMDLVFPKHFLNIGDPMLLTLKDVLRLHYVTSDYAMSR